MAAYKWDFFIAHAGADQRMAERLYRHLIELSSQNAKVFLDSEVLMLGDNWNTVLPREQALSKITVVLVSSKTESAYYQQEEIAVAVNLARSDADSHRVVPVFLDAKIQREKVPYGLFSKHSVTLSTGLTIKDVAMKLLDLLTRLNEKQGMPGEMPSPLSVPLPSPEISLHVSIMNKEEELFGDSDKFVRYETDIHQPAGNETRDRIIRFYPVCPYLEAYNNGGIIKMTSFNWEPFTWDFPTLDIKIVNNSDETILLNQAVFDIENSISDPFPVLIIKEDKYQNNALNFNVINDGWGMVRNMTVRFNLAPLTEVPGGVTGPYAYEIQAGDFQDQLDVNISDAFINEGVNLEKLDELGRVKRRSGQEWTFENEQGKESTLSTQELDDYRKSCLGPFREGGASVSGELQFKGETAERTLKLHTVRFQTVVWIYNENRLGLPRPPSYQYQAKFLIDGKNYRRIVNISQEIKPKEADRFTIKIGMEKSSRHHFRLQLLYNEEGVLESKDIELSAFISRFGIKFLQEKSRQNTE